MTSSPFISLVALIVTLGLLITVHEFGHFWVARRLGVRVLRFSIGFGKPLFRKTGADGTEYVVAAIPLGGYVRMLDEGEGNVPAHELDGAFNRKSVWTRIAVVLAGPFANFLFAIAAYVLMFMLGVSGTKPVVGEVVAGSVAERAGFRAGETLVSVDREATPTWSEVGMALLEAGFDGGSVAVSVRDVDARQIERLLDLSHVGESLEQGTLLEDIGLRPWRPQLPPIVDRLVPEGAAARDGLLPGDRILTVHGEPVSDWQTWAEYVRKRPEQPIPVQVDRGDRVVELVLTPDAVESSEGLIGRIGAYGRVPEDLVEQMAVTVRYGPIDATIAAVERTWDMSVFTLQMLGRMLIGKASLENLSGPITIAQFAGQTATIGATAFLAFLGLVSISLGVLNLLPVPILDGGHLLYYLIEALKGSPVSETVQAAGQRVGLVILVMLMGLAFYNDISRLVGS